MRDDIIKEPISIANGDVCYLTRDENGDYYCPVCGEITGIAPFEQSADGHISASYELICSDCRYQPGYDLHLYESNRLEDWKQQLLSHRITWLCRIGWRVAGIRNLVENLGIPFQEIIDYERLAGREQGLDRRFHEDAAFRKKSEKFHQRDRPPHPGQRREPEQPPRKDPTCPCCGRLHAISAMFQMCNFCGWYYVPVQELDPDDASEPNLVSLREAQLNYQKFGAKTEGWLTKLRKPELDLGIDPQWRPLKPRW